MSGRWATSTRKSSLPRDWRRRVAAVWRRAGGRCEALDGEGRRCTSRGRDVDHRLHRDDHRVSALQLLCGPHHDEKTQTEAAAARKRHKRPAGRHPGLL